MACLRRTILGTITCHPWDVLLHRERGGVSDQHQRPRRYPLQARCMSAQNQNLNFVLLRTKLMYALIRQGVGDLENDASVGFQVISTDDIDDYGVTEIIKRIRTRVGDTPVYLRFALNRTLVFTLLTSR